MSERDPNCPAHGEIPCGCDRQSNNLLHNFLKLIGDSHAYDMTAQYYAHRASQRRTSDVYQREPSCRKCDRYRDGLALSEIVLPQLERLFLWAEAHRLERGHEERTSYDDFGNAWCEGWG